MFEARDKIIEGTFSEPIDVEAVCRAINEDPNCLKNAEITNGNGSLKLYDRELIFLEIQREKLKNKKSVGRVVTDAVMEAYAEEYQDEGEEVLKVALKKYEKYYIDNLAGDEVCKDLNKSLKANEVRKKIPLDPTLPGTELSEIETDSMGTSLEWTQSNLLRLGYMFSEKAKESAVTIGNEGWEARVLIAMANNDKTRLKYLIEQAAGTMVAAGKLGIESSWREMYVRTMNEKYGDSKYPSIESAEGKIKFLGEVYAPTVAAFLAAPEIASVMGDKRAADATIKLKADIEIMIAESNADVAERVQPARAKVESARYEADAKIAEVLSKNEEVLAAARRIKAMLAAKTVAQPVFTFISQLGASTVETVPAAGKGFSQFLDRWMSQENVDRKLVAVTSGGVAIGLVGGAVAAFYLVNPWLIPVGAVLVPMITSSGYMAIKGFLSEEE